MRFIIKKSYNPISFVICAAGIGERFSRYGLTKVKPLLNLNGMTMLERSIESLNISPADQLIIISQRSHDLKNKFSHINCEWIEIEAPTRGQLETFMLSKDLIKHDKIVIYNCDTSFESKALQEVIHNEQFDGIIPCSIEPGESWSFCLVDQNHTVLKVAEKMRISEWASVGFYYFRGKDLLLKLAQEEINSTTDKETYVAPLYQRYIQKNMNIKMIPVDKFLPFGTIEQVKDYWGISLEELLRQNT